MPNSVYHSVTQSGPFLLVINEQNKKECYINVDSIVFFEVRLHRITQREYIHIGLSSGDHAELYNDRIRLKDLRNAIIEARRFS